MDKSFARLLKAQATRLGQQITLLDSMTLDDVRFELLENAKAVSADPLARGAAYSKLIAFSDILDRLIGIANEAGQMGLQRLGLRSDE